MSSSDSRKVRRIEDARRKKEKARHAGAWWFEVLEYYQPDKGERLSLQETLGYRSFVYSLGPENVRVVQVPANMPAQKVTELGEHMGKLGLQAIIVSENVKYMKLRPCSEAECHLLDEHDRNHAGVVIARTQNNGARSQSDGDGDCSDQPEARGGAPGGDQDEVVGSDDSPLGEDSE